MAMFSRCKKAELKDAVSGQTFAAGVSIGPMDSLMIAAPITRKVEAGTPLEIKFLDPALGVVTCRCKLTSPLISRDKRFAVYRCQVLEKLSQEQRREDIKIPITIKVRVAHRRSGGEAPAVLCNISASGVYLGTSLPVQTGDLLSFTLPTADAQIPLTAEVLRAESRADLGGTGCGCRFVHLAPQHETQLRAYIFQEERRLYRQQKEA